MKKYLKILEKIKENDKTHTTELAKIETYLKGEITPEELTKTLNIDTVRIFYLVINKILNYEEKAIRYYLELPTYSCKTRTNNSIIAANIEEMGIFNNIIKIIGPKAIIPWHNAFGDQNFIEITGDFSQIPTGITLFKSDKYKILSQYPKLSELYKRIQNPNNNNYPFENCFHQRIKPETIDLFKQQLINLSQEENNSEYSHNNTKYLSQEIINSINFVIPTEYLTMEQIITGDFGTFEELVNNTPKNIIPT